MDIHELLSGRQRGVGPALLRSCLWAAQAPYTLATSWRNRRFARSDTLVRHVEAPVVSVGNITTGGTGKTPMVDFLARWFRRQSLRVAIVSRGYGAEAGGKNDEALELELRLPDVPHLQNPNRWEAATAAIEELDSQVIVLDDGFQHRRLHRDLDLVLLDALEPFGYGHVLPRGLLRESLVGLRRASALILSRADAVDANERIRIRDNAMRYAGDKPWVEVAHAPQQFVSCDDRTELITSLANRRVAAFCGIGNPDGFRHTLATCGCEVVEMKVFPDHYDYDREDVQTLQAWARQLKVDAVICTEKDFVKIQLPDLSGHPLWALRIGLEVRSGESNLERLLAPVAELARSV